MPGRVPGADAPFTRLSPGSNKVRVIVESWSFWDSISDWPSGDGFFLARFWTEWRLDFAACGVVVFGGCVSAPAAVWGRTRQLGSVRTADRRLRDRLTDLKIGHYGASAAAGCVRPAEGAEVP